ncbi:hypothetical protein ACHAXT_006879 [Thalassiosira profunda]
MRASSSLQPPPRSCDTFVYVQAPSAQGAGTLFGKNSDRPSEERHEVVRVPRRDGGGGEVQCTYISVPQAGATQECILSKPSWMRGCEMGANESGVVGGNEAIHTVLSDELLSADGTPNKSLLGMDLLRLALERGATAKQAVEVCIQLLEEYGQGGPCCQTDTDWTYENSFLFADADEAYVLETAGRKHWAWERVEPGGYRNISNGVSIRSNWGAVSKDIRSICKENGWWDGSSEFDWKRAVGSGGSVVGSESCGGREAAGLARLKEMKVMVNIMPSPPHRRWWVEQMANVLRDEGSGICFRDEYGFCSTGSQISWLPAGSQVAHHFFSGASDPLCGTPYKHFLFSEPRPAEDDHKTNTLWDAWRRRALSRRTIGASLQVKLSNMEEEGLSCLESDDAKRQTTTFEEMVEEEIVLLDCDPLR